MSRRHERSRQGTCSPDIQFSTKITHHYSHHRQGISAGSARTNNNISLCLYDTHQFFKCYISSVNTQTRCFPFEFIIIIPPLSSCDYHHYHHHYSSFYLIDMIRKEKFVSDRHESFFYFLKENFTFLKPPFCNFLHWSSSRT